MTIKTSGAQVIAPSTPGQADGTVRVQIDIGHISNTDTVEAALDALPQAQHSGNLFSALALVMELLAAIHQHGGGS